jgi:L-lysine exporter family protein LysE/ArgO
MFLTLLKGFTAGASLLISIGPQGAFVIRQGLLRQHLFLTAFIFSLIDAILISFGTLGFGKILSNYPLTIEISKYFAIVFLFSYGALSLRSVFKTNSLKERREQIPPSFKKTVFLLLALSLFNPHVYLDTVILLGSIALQQPDHQQVYFAIGAISASFIWFFSLTFSSRFFAPLLGNSKSWKVIDCLITLTMWGIAFTLIKSIFS